MKTIFKCLVISAIYLLTFNTSAHAQLNYIGAAAGLNLSKLNYENDLYGYDFSFRNGVKAGLMAEYKLSNPFLIRAEINYSMKGTEYGTEAKFGFPKHKFVEKLNYIEIPVIFQYYIPVEFIIKPKLFVGPEISFLLDSKIEYIENDKSVSEYEDTDNWKSTEYGIVFGIGADYDLSAGKILFDIRYNYGLSSINKIEGNKVSSNTLLFNVGYAFKL